MDFHSDLADPDIVSDLFVEATSHYQRHHLALASRERLEARQW
jgi:hypothetical protein